MGASASAISALEELREEGVDDPALEKYVNEYYSIHEINSAPVERATLLTYTRKMDLEARDEAIALELLRLSEKERTRPYEQRRMRQLFRRNRSYNDLQMLSMDLKDSQLETLSKLYSAFPAVHPVDKSIDSALCEDALAKVGMEPQLIEDLMNFIIEANRRLQSNSEVNMASVRE